MELSLFYPYLWHVNCSAHNNACNQLTCRCRFAITAQCRHWTNSVLVLASEKCIVGKPYLLTAKHSLLRLYKYYAHILPKSSSVHWSNFPKIGSWPSQRRNDTVKLMETQMGLPVFPVFIELSAVIRDYMWWVTFPTNVNETRCDTIWSRHYFSLYAPNPRPGTHWPHSTSSQWKWVQSTVVWRKWSQ